MTEQEALLEAVRHTDISFFGPLFDFNYSQLSTILPTGERREEALKLTLANPIIARVGVTGIQNAVIEGTCGSKYFSQASRQMLEGFAPQTTQSELILK